MSIVQNMTKKLRLKKKKKSLSFNFVPLYQNQQECTMHPRQVEIWTMTFFRPHGMKNGSQSKRRQPSK